MVKMQDRWNLTILAAPESVIRYNHADNHIWIFDSMYMKQLKAGD